MNLTLPLTAVGELGMRWGKNRARPGRRLLFPAGQDRRPRGPGGQESPALRSAAPGQRKHMRGARGKRRGLRFQTRRQGLFCHKASEHLGGRAWARLDNVLQTPAVAAPGLERSQQPKAGVPRAWHSSHGCRKKRVPFHVRVNSFHSFDFLCIQQGPVLC